VGIFTLGVTDDVIGWIGLNKAIRGQGGVLEINPVVGVRNQQIERRVSDLTGDKFSEVVPPTLSGNLGYLMPENKYRPFMFHENDPIEPIVEELVAEVQTYGLPFVRTNADMGNLVKNLSTCRFAVSFVAAYRIPIGFFLLGQLDDAGAFLETERAKVEASEDPAALRFKAFAANLEKLIEQTRRKKRTI
jgi:hypothetical protein